MADEFHNIFHRRKLLVNSPISPLIQYLNPDETIHKAVSELLSKRLTTFVVEDNGKLIGYISGKIIRNKGKVFHTEGYVDDWFVRKNYRSKGIGRKLYKVLLKEFQKRNCSHLGIGAYAENKKAIDFYHKLGFKDFTLTLKKQF